MRKNEQLIVDKDNGDCFRACMTSILDIANDPDLAVGGDPEWFIKWAKFLGQFGLWMPSEFRAMWRHGYWVASVPSLNYEGVTHAIVMNGTEVAWDPSTKVKYKTGISLLGENVVLGCNYLEVVDPSLLHKLVEYQRTHQ